MHVAVTGAAGYIGSRLVDQLSATYPDWSVTALDNFYAGELREIGDVVVENVDVRDRDRLDAALAGADVVIHLAAISGVDDCESNPDAAYEVNVQGTENVAWFCRRTGAGMIFPYSMAILGDPERFPITVDLPRRPVNWYGRTKYLNELAVEAMAADAFPAHLLLKSNLYGSHVVDGRVVSKGTVINYFVDRALAGDTLTVYEPGTQARNFLHVKDAVDAYLRSVEALAEDLEGDETGATAYEIAGEESPSVMAVAELVRELAAEERGIDVPVELVENPRADETSVSDFAVDTSRARAELGWTPERTIAGTVRELLCEEAAPLADDAGST